MPSNETQDKTTGELRIELREVRAAVEEILNDYERTAETLDAVTEQASGLEATNHAANVQVLTDDLLASLSKESASIAPPWTREGYDSKEAWRRDR